MRVLFVFVCAMLWRCLMARLDHIGLGYGDPSGPPVSNINFDRVMRIVCLFVCLFVCLLCAIVVVCASWR